MGYKATKSGSIGQHRFRLGSDEKAAQHAENRLVAFWEALEGFFQTERKGERCLWEDWSLSIANEIKGGKINVALPALPVNFLDDLGLTETEIASLWRDILARHFGNVVGFQGVPAAVPENIYLGKGGYAVAAPKASSSGQTLFQSIDAYIADLAAKHQDANGRTTQTGKKEGERAERLKAHHADCPLATIDSKAIEAMLRYWSKRPLQANGKRYAITTCKMQLILIRAFLRWVHRSQDFAWKLPPDFLFQQQKISVLVRRGEDSGPQETNLYIERGWYPLATRYPP